MKINKVVYLIFFFLLVMMIVSCQNDVNIIWPEERDKDTVSITITTEYAHNREGMLYPGEKVTFESRSDSVKHILDDTKTVVWTVTEVSDKDNFMYSEHTDGGVTSIEKVFKNESLWLLGRTWFGRSFTQESTTSRGMRCSSAPWKPASLLIPILD